jgi:5'-nucleotidase
MTKLLLTNDDGIEAPGLQALTQAALPLGECVVVAPAGAQSGCSHQVTTGRPFRIQSCGVNRYAVHGTPADCTRLALHEFAKDLVWVLSGINAGGNLGADIYISGTVAAVREAVIHGRSGIAISHYLKRNLPVDWDRAARWTQRLLADLIARGPTPGRFWSINLPHLKPDDPDPEVVFCPLDPNPLPLSYRPVEDGGWHYDGDYHNRPRRPGSDVDVCFSGRIAVTQITLLDPTV